MAHPDPRLILLRQTRIFRVLAAFAVAVSLIAVAGQIIFVAAPLWKGGPVGDTVVNIGRQVVLCAPVLFYVGGLYHARRVFRRIGGGEIFARANGEGLRAMGWCLLVGALWAMLAEGLVPYSPAQPLGQTLHEVGRSVSDPVLAALGLALIMIGRLLSTAAALKAENDAFV